MYNRLGQEIDRIKGISGDHRLNVSDYPAGVYLMKVTTPEETKVLRFIKR